MPLRIVFFGTPVFAVPTLDRLIASDHDVVAVVTQPDRPRGRGQRLAPPAVKARAAEAGVPVLQPERLRDEALMARLREWRPDLGVVAAYGRLLPQALLDLPRFGMINVHASLLPRWRGAAPVHRAIMEGDRTTGVTIMQVVEALDAGPMLARTSVEIGPDETSEELEQRLARAGGQLLADVVDRLAVGPAHLEPQDDAAATYARKIDRADSPIDWARPAAAVHNQVRGLHPWPLAATWLADRRLLIRRTDVQPGDAGNAAPGTVVKAGDELVVAAGHGQVRLLEVQPEGRAPMAARAFVNGYRLAAGVRFGARAP
jgi:methionyl-tRNA formyltransferase